MAFGTETFRSGSIIFQPSISEGQSFFRQASSKNWKDMADYKACFRIKAFANDYDDTTAPEILADSLKPAPGSTGQLVAGDSFVFSLQVKDDLAVDRVTVVFEAESSKKNLEVSLSRSDEIKDQWDGKLEITESTETGAWNVKEIRAADITGNEAVLYNSKVSEQTPSTDLSAVSLNVIDPGAAIQAGWQKAADGKWYYCNADGTLSTGWFRDNSQWYYLDNTTGAMKTGWIHDQGHWYYLRPNGAMATGWRKIKTTWYYFKPDGAMTTGWRKIRNVWYFFKPNGAMTTGWRRIRTVWYYFRADGSMASQEWIHGYRLDSDGCWTYEPTAKWRKNRIGWWYEDTSGWYARRQWLKIDGILYYFDASGYMVTGKQVIDGKTCIFGGDGAFIK